MTLLVYIKDILGLKVQKSKMYMRKVKKRIHYNQRKNWDKTGPKLGQNCAKTGTKLGQNFGTKHPIFPLRLRNCNKTTNFFNGFFFELGQNWDKPGPKLGHNQDKTKTKLGQNWDKTGTKLGQNWDKTGTKLGPLIQIFVEEEKTQDSDLARFLKVKNLLRIGKPPLKHHFWLLF